MNVCNNIIMSIYKINFLDIISDNVLNLNFQISKTDCLEFAFPSIYEKMCKIKSKIDTIGNDLYPDSSFSPSFKKCNKKIIMKLWNRAKKNVNPYESICNEGTNIFEKNLEIEKKINRNGNLSDICPLSRAFFKLSEIMSIVVNFIPDDIISSENNNKILCIAEGPGGFIEALYKNRLSNKDEIIGLTLFPKKKEIPGWNKIYRKNKHFLNNNKRVKLIYGDLYDISLIKRLKKEYFSKNAPWIVTGDGGFDFSDDFNNQEKNASRIIYSEIVFSMSLLRKNGTMVCKMFDIFTLFSVQLLYIVSLFFKRVYLVKPYTSRPANSEKYLVCCEFKGCPDDILQTLKLNLQNWESFSAKDKKENGFKFKNLDMPKKFIEEVKKIILFLTNNQTEYINKTIKETKLYVLKKHSLHSHISSHKGNNLWFRKSGILSRNEIMHKFKL